MKKTKLEDTIHSLEARVTSIEQSLHQFLQGQAAQTQLLQQLLNTSNTIQTLHVSDNKSGEIEMVPHTVAIQSLEDLHKKIEARRRTRKAKIETIIAEDRRIIEELRVHTKAMAKTKEEGKSTEIIKLEKVIEEINTMTYPSTNEDIRLKKGHGIVNSIKENESTSSLVTDPN